MAASIYDNNLIKPTDKILVVDLKKSKDYFDEICSFIKSNYGDITPEWKFYNKKSGWVLKLFNKKRNVLFIVPCQAYFKAVFTFGEKATDLVLLSDLPQFIKNELTIAKKYAEGRTIQIDVKQEIDCKFILKLIEIKLTN